MHYDVISNAVLWFLHHGLFDLARRPALRPSPARRVGRLRRGERRVRQGRRPTTPRTASRCWCTTTSSRWCPAWCARLAPTCRSRTSPTPPSAAPTRSGCCRPTWPRRCARSMAAVPAGFHTERWARGVPRHRRREVLGRAPDRAVRNAARTRPRRARRARRRRPRPSRAAAELDELVGDRKLVLRSDRIDLSKNIVRGFHVYDELLATHPEWRERVVFVAMLNRSRENLAEYLAYEQEVDQAAARVNDRWGTRRLAAGRGRHARRLRADHRRVHPLRRPAREPGEGRPEPRGQGRPAAQPPRRRGAASRRRQVRTRSSPTRRWPIHPYDIEQGAHALHTALAMPDDERAARAHAAARARRGAHAADLATRAAQPARAERVGERVEQRPPGPPDRRPRRRPRCTSGGLSADATPMLTPWRSTPSRTSACSAANAGRSPASSPANAADRCAAARSATVVPLSTGTGGRSSTAIRPRSGRAEPQARRRLVGPRQRLGPAVGLGAPVDGDGHTRPCAPPAARAAPRRLRRRPARSRRRHGRTRSSTTTSPSTIRSRP